MISEVPSKRTLAREISRNYDSEAEAKKASHDAVQIRERLRRSLRTLRAAFIDLGEDTYLRMAGKADASSGDPEALGQRIAELLTVIAEDRRRLDEVISGRAQEGADGGEADDDDGGEADGGNDDEEADAGDAGGADDVRRDDGDEG